MNDFDEPMSLKDGTTVLQFENRLQNGLESGGAYLKYLRPQEAGWKPKEFDNESPYSIMFGLDKCGATNKAHFILKHKNLKSGEYVEHHFKYPLSLPCRPCSCQTTLLRQFQRPSSAWPPQAPAHAQLQSAPPSIKRPRKA